jgi:hypothetical protein
VAKIVDPKWGDPGSCYCRVPEAAAPLRQADWATRGRGEDQPVATQAEAAKVLGHPINDKFRNRHLAPRRFVLGGPKW